MIKPTNENIEKLAQDIVNCWDEDTLIQFAYDSLCNSYSQMGPADFDEEWNNFYNED